MTVIVTVGVGVKVGVSLTVIVGVGVSPVEVGVGPMGWHFASPFFPTPHANSPLAQGRGSKQNLLTQGKLKHWLGPVGPPQVFCHLNSFLL